MARIWIQNVAFNALLQCLFSQKDFHIATLSFMPLGNHQATNAKKYEITTTVLKSTNPYLLDQVEFKHQFVRFNTLNVPQIVKNGGSYKGNNNKYLTFNTNFDIRHPVQMI